MEVFLNINPTNYDTSKNKKKSSVFLFFHSLFYEVLTINYHVSASQRCKCVCQTTKKKKGYQEYDTRVYTPPIVITAPVLCDK